MEAASRFHSEDEAGNLARLREELRQEHEAHVRALADFDSYRRRVERQQASAARGARREMILPLLDVLDDFDRALEPRGRIKQPQMEHLLSIREKLLRLLEQAGVTIIDSRGRIFNNRLHEAVSFAESEDRPSGTIIEEMQRGYQWGEEVLRPARVKVAR
jgi:molecular chaperone GrpE